MFSVFSFLSIFPGEGAQLTPFAPVCRRPWLHALVKTRSSAIAEGPRDASCQLKYCQLPHNSAETTYTTSPDQIDGMKLEI